MIYQPDYQLDHIVIAVAELEAAMGEYQALGFTVTRGGAHPGFGSRNALVPFEDGSYLELVAFEGEPAAGESPAARRQAAWRGGEGIVDFALLPQAIEHDVAAARRAGLAMTEPQAGARRRPDGELVEWRFSFPDDRALPFLCADVTPRERRVPPGGARQHANGAMGVLRLTVAVRDLDEAQPRYEALLAQRGAPGSLSALPATQLVEFPLGEATLALAAPLGEESPLYAHLAQQGDGPYALQLRTRRPDAAGALDEARTHGARIALLYA